MNYTHEAHSSGDVETGKRAYLTTTEPIYEEGSGSGSGTAHEVGNVIELKERKGFFRSLRKGEDWLDSKLGIETRGIDRIPDDEKQPPSSWNMLLLWWSLNVHVGVIPLGILGPAFGLTLGQSVAANIIGNVLGALCTSYTATLGPKVRTPKRWVARDYMQALTCHTDRSSPDCDCSLFIWLLRRIRCQFPKRHNRRWLQCGQLRRRRPDAVSSIRLHHEHHGGHCDHRSPLLYHFSVWLQGHPHV